MRGLATFVMRGRWQAVLVVSIMAILAPPFSSILSGAAMGLVTLRQGLREALLIMSGSALVTALLGFWLSGSGLVAVGFVVVLWLPMLLMGVLLRQTTSLAWVMQSAAAVVIALIALIYLFGGDPTQFWLHELGWLKPLFIEAQIATEGPQLDAVVMAAAVRMNSMVLMSFILNLLLARWWQAQLYNPGGFCKEFHALRLPRESAIAVVVIGAAAALLSGTPGDFFRDAGLIFITIYLFAGLALVHTVVARRRMGKGWLVAIYGLLVLLPPASSVLALLGLVDSWMNLRGHVQDIRDT